MADRVADREGPPAAPSYWEQRGFPYPNILAVAWRWGIVDDDGKPNGKLPSESLVAPDLETVVLQEEIDGCAAMLRELKPPPGLLPRITLSMRQIYQLAFVAGARSAHKEWAKAIDMVCQPPVPPPVDAAAVEPAPAIPRRRLIKKLSGLFRRKV